MSGFAWHPSKDALDTTRIGRFMQHHEIGSVSELRARSAAEQDWFWQAIVDDMDLVFDQPYQSVFDLSKGAPWTDWFVGGQLNIARNCLERHAQGPLAKKTCLVGHTETGERRTFSFEQLDQEVSCCALAMKARGIGKGDRVASYMPMITEVVIQMLATFKLGAIFIPVFSGYAPAALAERLNGAEAKLLFTSDRSSRKGKAISVLPQAQEALAQSPSVTTMVIVARPALNTDPEPPQVELSPERDVLWADFLAAPSSRDISNFEALSVDSMDPALILFTSGTTGRPKGTVHSHAGTMVQLAKEVGYAFDMHEDDEFFWFTDIGWMMGPWMIIGGLFWGATVHMYEGAIDYPTSDQLWRLLETEKISVFGISPTAIRMLMRTGTDDVEAHDLAALRILGSTGEPWDEDSWHWYSEHVGGSRCPVINISGGTDIIGCFLSPLPIEPIKPCSLAGPALGMAVDVWNDDGESVRGEVGYLVATHPAPSMTRGLWNEPQRYLDSYWTPWPEIWNHGDWAIVDDDGQWFLQGRSDDTLKVAGRRIGPAELEGALIETGKVSEAAAIGVPHEIKGTGIVCFAVLKPQTTASAELLGELEEAIVERLGKVDRPEKIIIVGDLPKTRSAKILRRMVRARYLGEDLGDLSSLQNPEAIEGLPTLRDNRLAD